VWNDAARIPALINDALGQTQDEAGEKPPLIISTAGAGLRSDQAPLFLEGVQLGLRCPCNPGWRGKKLKCLMLYRCIS